jgi:hypothetical protein
MKDYSYLLPFGIVGALAMMVANDNRVFNADNRFKGVSFNIGDDENETIVGPVRSKQRSVDEIVEMIDMVMNRLVYYKKMYNGAKKEGNKKAQYLAIRNYKALEGANQALRWSLSEKDVGHPLY